MNRISTSDNGPTVPVIYLLNPKQAAVRRQTFPDVVGSDVPIIHAAILAWCQLRDVRKAPDEIRRSLVN